MQTQWRSLLQLWKKEGNEKMKITLDIPDTTVCAFFDFVYFTETGLAMQGHSIQTDELKNGGVITIKEGVTQE